MIDGLFQAIAVRTAGFTIVTLADTAPALQLLYLVRRLPDVPRNVADVALTFNRS